MGLSKDNNNEKSFRKILIYMEDSDASLIELDYTKADWDKLASAMRGLATVVVLSNCIIPKDKITHIMAQA
jgi:hypothetical protein